MRSRKKIEAEIFSRFHQQREPESQTAANPWVWAIGFKRVEDGR